MTTKDTLSRMIYRIMDRAVYEQGTSEWCEDMDVTRDDLATLEMLLVKVVDEYVEEE